MALLGVYLGSDRVVRRAWHAPAYEATLLCQKQEVGQQSYGHPQITHMLHQ